MKAYEVNFDGLVGLTHNFAGLSIGNVASEKNAGSVSKPKKAALQGLSKMKALHDLGLKQGVFCPQERPDLTVLRRLGFTGDDTAVLNKVSRRDPQLLYAVSSASSMWVANACTTSPSIDSADAKVHFTPANLSNKFHRSIEWPCTSRMLKAIFPSEDYFRHHEVLPESVQFGDEGAANHTRFCRDFGDKGIQLFIFGKSALHDNISKPQRFPARQTRESVEALVRLHQLDPARTVIAQQNPQAIDAGVFHNDVIAVGNQHVHLFHEHAFLDAASIHQALKEGLDNYLAIEVKNDEVPLKVAVDSYLFNSQLLTLPDQSMLLLAPSDCEKYEQTKSYLSALCADTSNPITQVRYFELRESMKNGGGPACLRQRVILTEEELQQVNPACLLNDDNYTLLCSWVEKYYRDELSLQDLADPQFLRSTREALDELTQILKLGNIYQFQL